MENKTISEWERIEEIRKHCGANTVAELAHRIGLKRGENLYQIKRGNNGISKQLAERIVRYFPEISKLWLLTGEGNPVRPDEELPRDININVTVTFKVENK
ncbi:MAG: helix-turn-helix transcriptional regulator [Alistipes sp.]|nr:helix-turn-helix transcriptional regulator [Alistipes sp.]